MQTLSAHYAALQANYDACGCTNSSLHDSDSSCKGADLSGQGLDLHIAAIFIVLVASAIGAGIPTMAKHLRWHEIGFYIALGKTIGTGVVLACGFIHMLQPAAESLVSDCLPRLFTEVYPAFAYLYALVAALGMQFLDLMFVEYATSRQLARMQPGADAGSVSTNANRKAASALEDKHVLLDSATTSSDVDLPPPSSAAAVISSATTLATHGKADLHALLHPSRLAENEEAHVGHSHPRIELDGTTRKLIEAYVLEFGVTVHSVFIGLAVGVMGRNGLRALLTALCFHQFFEGVALGSRIVEANFPSRWHEVLMALIFTISAPIGIAVAIAVTSTLNAEGRTFLLVQGTFDGLCAGILIYIGFTLLVVDFPSDLRKHCANKPRSALLKSLMFACLWVGAGLMAFIGKYL